MTADEVHDIGLGEVARIRGEMEAIRRPVGFTGTLAEFFEICAPTPVQAGEPGGAARRL